MTVQMPDNPLQALLWKAWTTEGFAESLAASPHECLSREGVVIAREIPVAIFGVRSEGKHLCPSCQLAVPGVYLRIGSDLLIEASDTMSPLVDVFVRARDPAFLDRAVVDGRGVLAERGLALTDNVRVRVERASATSLELQLCEGFHACLCATPHLQEHVSRLWLAIYDRPS